MTADRFRLAKQMYTECSALASAIQYKLSSVSVTYALGAE